MNRLVNIRTGTVKTFSAIIGQNGKCPWFGQGGFRHLELGESFTGRRILAVQAERFSFLHELNCQEILRSNPEIWLKRNSLHRWDGWSLSPIEQKLEKIWAASPDNIRYTGLAGIVEKQDDGHLVFLGMEQIDRKAAQEQKFSVEYSFGAGKNQEIFNRGFLGWLDKNNYDSSKILKLQFTYNMKGQINNIVAFWDSMGEKLFYAKFPFAMQDFYGEHELSMVNKEDIVPVGTKNSDPLDLLDGYAAASFDDLTCDFKLYKLYTGLDRAVQNDILKRLNPMTVAALLEAAIYSENSAFPNDLMNMLESVKGMVWNRMRLILGTLMLRSPAAFLRMLTYMGDNLTKEYFRYLDMPNMSIVQTNIGEFKCQWNDKAVFVPLKKKPLEQLPVEFQVLIATAAVKFLNKLQYQQDIDQSWITGSRANVRKDSFYHEDEDDHLPRKRYGGTELNNLLFISDLIARYPDLRRIISDIPYQLASIAAKPLARIFLALFELRGGFDYGDIQWFFDAANIKLLYEIMMELRNLEGDIREGMTEGFLCWEEMLAECMGFLLHVEVNDDKYRYFINKFNKIMGHNSVDPYTSRNNISNFFDVVLHLMNMGMDIDLGSMARSLESEKEIIKGNFDKNNPVHLILNYFVVRKLTSVTSEKALTINDYLEMLGSDAAVSSRNDLSRGIKLQVRAVAYEAYLTRQKILEIEQRARDIGRKVIVVANLSYGEVALAPIVDDSSGHKVIVGTDIPVIETKVGSTESHHDEYVLRPVMFTEKQLKNLLNESPVVIVVDASTSVSDPQRTSPHIPDGFKGYRNYFMAMNKAKHSHIDPGSFVEDAHFVQGLEAQKDFKELVGKMRRMTDDADGSAPYQLFFWYPGSKELYLRVNKKKGIIAPKLDSLHDIKGPAVVFLQSAIEAEAVPADIRKNFMYGREHTPAFFDDRDHFRQFILGYRKDWGVVKTKKFASLAAFYFRELANVLGIKIAEKVTGPINVRPIDFIFADLDGVLAVTDEHIPASIIDQLSASLAKSKRFALLTEDIEANMEERLLQYIPAEMRKNLLVFPDGAAMGFTFDDDGRKKYFNEYNDKGKINAELRAKIINILKDNFKDQFEVDSRPNRISPDYRIDINKVKMPRNDFIEKVQKLFDAAGIKVKMYKAGRTSIKIVLHHKEDAVKFCIDHFGAEMAKSLMIADSARVHQIDRRLLASFPEAVSVNVGTPSNTIGKENSNIHQLADQGISAALRLLTYINQHDGIDEGMIDSLEERK